MKILRLALLFLLIGLVPAFAAPKRVELHKLTISGTAVDTYLIASSQTVTTDSIYISGNNGYQSLVVTTGGNNGAVTIDTQVSYDNTNWFTPYSMNSPTNDTLTAQGRIADGITANRWIILPWTLSPYVRFKFAVGSVTNDTITAETLWQDES